MAYDLESVGGRIKWALDQAGLNQTEFARIAKMQRSAVSRWINNPERGISDVSLDMIETHTGIPAAWLKYGGRLPASVLDESFVRSITEQGSGTGFVRERFPVSLSRRDEQLAEVEQYLDNLDQELRRAVSPELKLASLLRGAIQRARRHDYSPDALYMVLEWAHGKVATLEGRVEELRRPTTPRHPEDGSAGGP